MFLSFHLNRSLWSIKGLQSFPSALITSKITHANSYNMSSAKTNKGLRFGVVGSGPAGMHISKQILKDIPNASVDVYDKMPFPFGLIRTGVAPDHQDVKKVLREFTKVGEHQNFSFYGNVEVGTNISIKVLRKLYSAVILAYGAEGDKKLWLEGEDNLKGIYAARAIVNWYNSHPEHNYLDEQLFKDHKMKNMVIIGNGNVAIDVARIFSKKVEELQETDINDKTLDLRKVNPTENVIIVGRRGCIQAAFTTKTLRELLNMEDVEVYIMKEDIDSSLNEASKQEYTDPLDFRFRANKRKFELLKTAKTLNSEQELSDLLKTKPKGTRIIFRFLMSPTKLIGEDGKIKAVECSKNLLEGQAFDQKAKIDSTKDKVTIDCDILLRSIGYQSKPIEDIIFDKKNYIIPNSNGCVLSSAKEDMVEVGLYVTGWIKTGPVGVVDTTLKDSLETYVNLKQHFLKGYFEEKEDPREKVEDILKKNNVEFTSFKHWQKANEVEVQKGELLKKIRDKIKTKEEYLKLCK